jgi:hypothetical protein
MDAGFIQYLREQRGFQPGDTIATKQQYDAMYKQYLKDTGGGGNYQPAIVNVPLPGSTNTVPAFMSSANSATLMKDASPKVTYKPDEDGNLLAIEGTLANVVTNAQGKPIKVDPKSGRLEDLVTLMGGGAAPAEQEPGFFSRVFGGVKSSPTPTPSPTPEATPTPAPAAATNAPTAAPTPAVFSAAQFKQMSGRDLPPGDYADAQGRPFSIR